MASNDYAEWFVNKKTQFFIKSGSVVKKRYFGSVYDVRGDGSHPVWRYGKGMFVSI